MLQKIKDYLQLIGMILIAIIGFITIGIILILGEVKDAIKLLFVEDEIVNE